MSTATVHEALLIPDLLRSAPQARPVLDRYGLRGCGGPLGPVESLGYFAKAHDVPVDRLLSELRTAVADRAAPPAAVADPADRIYRPFFKAGIAIVLTLGATWGGYLLWQIGLSGTFRAAGLHAVNAHGHAQIFGWVGLFVMGFAYQAFPRFKHTTLVRPRLAFATLGLMLTGILCRSLGEPLMASVPWAFYPAVLGGVLEVIAISTFAALIVATWRASGKPLAVYDAYIACALFWFVVQAVYEAVYFTATALVTDRLQLVGLVVTWQGTLRAIQINGFALLMILGVSQRLLPNFYGLPVPNPRRAKAALVVLNAAVVAEALGLTFMRQGGHGWAGLWYAGVLMLAGSVVYLLRDWRIFSKPAETDRGLKFLRAAYVWLLISLGMAVLLPAYQFGLLPLAAADSAAARDGFSHAYYGAVRHAVTVGFVSMMIVGVASKIVPTLNGVDVRRLPALWLPFALINLGCALRVLTQTLTDVTTFAFPAVGVSAVLEISGLALWGAHLWRIMARGAVLDPERPGPPDDGRPVTADDYVGPVLDRHPELLPVFLAHGFTPLASPGLRRTAARWVTIRGACRRVGVDEAAFLRALAAARPAAPRKLNLPMIQTT
jgi:hypothetical protein